MTYLYTSHTFLPFLFCLSHVVQNGHIFPSNCHCVCPLKKRNVTLRMRILIVEVPGVWPGASTCSKKIYTKRTVQTDSGGTGWGVVLEMCDQGNLCEPPVLDWLFASGCLHTSWPRFAWINGMPPRAVSSSTLNYCSNASLNCRMIIKIIWLLCKSFALGEDFQQILMW